MCELPPVRILLITIWSREHISTERIHYQGQKRLLDQRLMLFKEEDSELLRSVSCNSLLASCWLQWQLPFIKHFPCRHCSKIFPCFNSLSFNSHKTPYSRCYNYNDVHFAARRKERLRNVSKVIPLIGITEGS